MRTQKGGGALWEEHLAQRGDGITEAFMEEVTPGQSPRKDLGFPFLIM